MPAVKLKYVRPPGLSQSQWQQLAGKAYRAAKEATPIDTGRLQSSWRQLGQTMRSVTLETDNRIAPYASYVHDGRKQKTPYSARQVQNLHFTDRAVDQLNKTAWKMLAQGVKADEKS